MSKTRCGDKYHNVILSSDELNELATTYPDRYVDYINRLDEHIEKGSKLGLSHFDTLIHWLKREGVSSITSDLIAQARKIFIDFDGHNQNEIAELRKQWQPECSKCGSAMELLKFTKEEIGHPPASIFICPECVNYCHVEVSGKTEACGEIRPRTIITVYGEDPEALETDQETEDIIAEIEAMKKR